MDLPRRFGPLSPTSLLAYLLLVAVCLTLSVVPLRGSHDEFWHLKTGALIRASGGLPEKDPFTYTAADYDWRNHEWLSQVLLHSVWEIGERSGEGGVRAVIFFKAAAITLTFLALAFFLGRATGLPALGALAAALAADLARRTMYPRPPFITYGFLALTVCALLAWRAGRGRWTQPIALVPIFVLWANLHGGVLAGLVVVGAFWVEALIHWSLARWRLEESAPPRARAIQMTVALLGCFLATMATPSGAHLIEMTARVMNDELLRSVIFELQPPDWRFVWALDGCLAMLVVVAARPQSARELAVALALAALSIAIFRAVGSAAWGVWSREIVGVAAIPIASARAKPSVGWAPAGLAVFFLHQGIHHVRHLPLLGIVLAPVIAFSIADALGRDPGGWRRMWRSPRSGLLSEEDWTRVAARRLAAGQFASLLALAALAGTLVFLPEEISALTSPPEARPPSLLSRNLDLLLDRQWTRRIERGTTGPPTWDYPKEAVDRLLELRPPGRLFNGGNYAGYLIWRLSPESYCVFTDNRYDIYGSDFLVQEKIVLEGFEGDPDRGIPNWRETLDRWGVNVALLPESSGLARRLRELFGDGSRDWRLDFSDGRWAIWTRAEPIPIPPA